MALLVNIQASAEIPPGSVNLHAYPGLTHAPQQHGEGIRFACNGRSVDELKQYAAMEWAAHLSVAIDEVAGTLGVSFADICDGLKYLRDTKAI